MKKVMVNLTVLMVVGMLAITVTSSEKTIKTSTTLYVGGSGSGNYTSIQSAINDANNGDTIYVYHGTYQENLIINKQVTLIGENRLTTIIDGRGAGVIRVTTDYVTITNFTIKSNAYGDDADGINLLYNHHNTITNCTFNVSDTSIWLTHSSNNQIVNCDFCGNFNGIILDKSSNYNQITYNNIKNNSNGGICNQDEKSQYNLIHHNNFINNGFHACDVSTNYWNDSQEGNYWDDYTGKDYDGDGIGDTPYKIFPYGKNGSQDNYPLIFEIEMNRPCVNDTDDASPDDTNNEDNDSADETPSNNDTNEDNETTPDDTTNETDDDTPVNDTTNETSDDDTHLDDVSLNETNNTSTNETQVNEGKEKPKSFIPDFELTSLLMVLCVNMLLIKFKRNVYITNY